MSALDVFKHALRAHLGTEILLRRDQAARALFICDAPRRAPDAPALRGALEQSGFTVTQERGLWRIDLSPAWQEAFVQSLHPGPAPSDPAWRSLCRSLRARGEPRGQPWPLIRLTLLRLDAREEGRLYGELSAAVAVCKRTHAPLPAAAASLIEENRMKEERIC